MLKIAITAKHANEIANASQKRFRIRGTSIKKFDRSTSFLVAPHVILYENMCVRRATVRWILRPPPKKLSLLTRNEVSERNQEKQEQEKG